MIRKMIRLLVREAHPSLEEENAEGRQTRSRRRIQRILRPIAEQIFDIRRVIRTPGRRMLRVVRPEAGEESKGFFDRLRRKIFDFRMVSLRYRGVSSC
jgi:hypothetical protein